MIARWSGILVGSSLATAMIAATWIARADPDRGAPSGTRPPSRPAADKRSVHVVASGRAEDIAALGSTLQELLARIGVGVVVESGSPAQAHSPASLPSARELATVGVDLGAAGVLIVVADSSGQERMRRTLPPARDRGAAIEEAAHVVQAAIEALTERVEGGEAGDAGVSQPSTSASGPRVAASGTAVVPSPAGSPTLPGPLVAPLTRGSSGASGPSRETREPVTTLGPVADGERATDGSPDLGSTKARSRAPLGLDILAGLDTTIDGARSGVVIGGELGVVVRRARTASWFAPSVWMFGDYRAPFRAVNDDVALDVTTVSARVLPTLGVVRGESWSVEAGVGAGLDVVIARPSTTEPLAALVSSTRTDVDPMLTTMVALHTAIASSADLFVAARLDVDLGTERYDAAGVRGPITVFDPWTLRPELLVGFTLGLLGAPDYPQRRATP